MNRAGRPLFTWAKNVTYSQAVVTDAPLVFVSGQGGFGDDGTVTAPDDFEAQIRQTYANMATILEAEGASLATLISQTVYLLRAGDVEIFRSVRRELFAPPYPATTAIIVAGLVLPGMLVEIDAVAAVAEPRTQDS